MERKNNTDDIMDGRKPLREDYRRKPKNAKQWSDWAHQDDQFDEAMNQFIDEEDIFYDYH
jgi:hypothetical protein